LSTLAQFSKAQIALFSGAVFHADQLTHAGAVGRSRLHINDDLVFPAAVAARSWLPNWGHAAINTPQPNKVQRFISTVAPC
jgi:hypothetical protein